MPPIKSRIWTPPMKREPKPPPELAYPKAEHPGIWVEPRPRKYDTQDCDCLHWVPSPKFGDRCPNCQSRWAERCERTSGVIDISPLEPGEEQG